MKKQVIPVVALCSVFGFLMPTTPVAHASAPTSAGAVDARFESNLKRAQSGDADKQMTVGCDYLDGNGVEKNEKQGLYWLNSAIEAGSSSAAYELAGRLEAGKGVEKNMAEALKFYRLAADRLSVLAQRELGRIYAGGVGTPRDPAQAYVRYDLASRLGYDDALDARDVLAKALSADQLEAAKKTAQTLWSRLPSRKTKVAELNRRIFVRRTAPKADKPGN